jgi:hypothetical protein
LILRVSNRLISRDPPPVVTCLSRQTRISLCRFKTLDVCGFSHGDFLASAQIEAQQLCFLTAWLHRRENE